MVLVPIIRHAIRLATLYSKRTVDIDYKLLRKAGYGPGAARGVSHGIFAGSIGNYMKESGPNTDDGKVPKPYGPKAYKSDKARGRQYKYSRRKYAPCDNNGSGHRYSNSRRYTKRRNW